jgi:hypothetical protein
LLVDSFKAEYTEIFPLAALAMPRLPTRATPTPLATRCKKRRLLHVVADWVYTLRSSSHIVSVGNLDPTVVFVGLRAHCATMLSGVHLKYCLVLPVDEEDRGRAGS